MIGIQAFFIFRLFMLSFRSCFCDSCVLPSRGKDPRKQQMRIHEGHFLKSALNLDLTLSNARSRQADAARIFFMVVGAFCVELRPFYCNERISVPMSYISLSGKRITSLLVQRIPCYESFPCPSP